MFADGVRRETEHQPLGLESGGSEPIGFAGQQPQTVDSEDDAQTGELSVIETIDPAILNGHDSPDAEPAANDRRVSQQHRDRLSREVHSLSEESIIPPTQTTELKGDDGH